MATAGCHGLGVHPLRGMLEQMMKYCDFHVTLPSKHILDLRVKVLSEPIYTTVPTCYVLGFGPLLELHICKKLQTRQA